MPAQTLSSSPENAWLSPFPLLSKRVAQVPLKAWEVIMVSTCHVAMHFLQPPVSLWAPDLKTESFENWAKDHDL